MTQQEALSILIQAAQIAQSKGAYSLKEAKIIAEAIEVFVPKTETNETTEESEVNENSNMNSEVQE
jgi:hypothetical protein